MVDEISVEQEDALENTYESPLAGGNWSHSGVGATVEIEVAIDLMKKGFAVFRNLSPVGPVDMVAISMGGNGLVLKIQATAGKIKKPATRVFSRHTAQKNWNVLAVGFPEGIQYFDRRGNPLTLIGWSRSPIRLCSRPKPMIIKGRTMRQLYNNWTELPGHPEVQVRAWGPAFLATTRPKDTVDSAANTTHTPMTSPSP